MSQDDRPDNGFPPLLLGLLSLVLWFAFQTTELLKNRDAMTALRTSQVGLYDTAQKMRAQLDTIAADLAKLAQAGNANALQMVNALKQRGVTIDLSKAKPN